MNTSTPLPQEDIIRFLRENIEPFPDTAFGAGYRASVTLTDGLYLPCVVFRNPDTIVDLAIKRFHDERTGKIIFKWPSGQGYREIVRNFVTNGNCLNYFDVAQVGISPYAFPQAILSQIEGETRMGWSGFVTRMKDGKLFAFGTSFYSWFFDLPPGYTTDDIAGIINHSYLDGRGISGATRPRTSMSSLTGIKFTGKGRFSIALSMVCKDAPKECPFAMAARGFTTQMFAGVGGMLL